MSSEATFSQKGIKISYIRFLSDSASGFIILVLYLSNYFQNRSLLWIDIPVLNIQDISNEIYLTFLFLLFFLLSTPIGLIVNAISHFILSRYTNALSSCFISDYFNLWCIRNIRHSFSFEEWRNLFGLTRHNWHQISASHEIFLESYFSNLLEKIKHAIGLKILCRNICLLFLFFFINEVYNYFKIDYIHPFQPFNFLIFFLAFFCLTSLLTYYVQCFCFSRIYVLLDTYDIFYIHRTLDPFETKNLIQNSLKKQFFKVLSKSDNTY